MLLNLVCSEPLKKILTELVESRGLKLSPEAALTLIEKGFELPARGLAVVFDYQSLSELMDFLDALARKPDMSNTMIAGRHPDSDTYELIAYDTVMYFEAEGNYTYCMTADTRFRVKSKLYELETVLLEQGFVRIAKSLLVNILNVAEITPWFGSRLLLRLKNKQEIEVSRSYVKSFKTFLEL